MNCQNMINILHMYIQREQLDTEYINRSEKHLYSSSLKKIKKILKTNII